ncbi:MAG: chemotaxis protein CheB [Actinomycetota bacterium]|nr:chemotaxis protein CheB [Actinomycetota bacterium]
MNEDHIILVGGSWGGMRAAGLILGTLPRRFPAAVVIAQHRSHDSTGDSMATFLASRSQLPVSEAEDKQVIEGGRVYLAPADYHLLIEPGTFALSTDEKVQYSRPSIDVLFASAADSYGSRAVGVILTGANEDGARGLAQLKRAGATTIAQDPSTADRPEMPQAAIERGAATVVLPLADIGAYLVEKASEAIAEQGRGA